VPRGSYASARPTARARGPRLLMAFKLIGMIGNADGASMTCRRWCLRPLSPGKEVTGIDAKRLPQPGQTPKPSRRIIIGRSTTSGAPQRLTTTRAGTHEICRFETLL
jgi:hypothetical protein